ncbi:DUF3006 domain-containing protein [bacterium]|nr:DUF3006 domain-containing protein [bacterium]
MRFVIDRFEGDIAVLVNDVTINIPRSILPGYAKEGDVVIIELKIDIEETERLRREVEDKLGRLKEGEEKGDIWL